MGLRTYEGAVAVVTGGASGIGLALATELVARGARVVLADRDVDGADDAARKLGASAGAMACDVAVFREVSGVVHRTVSMHGRLDYLFNNAGVVVVGEEEDLSPGSWQQVLDVNLGGVVHGVQAAYPQMVQQGFGHIVNTASVAGFLATPGFVSYGASKHAVVGLSAGLRVEAAVHGVRVSALCPGFVRTPILTGGKFGSVPEDVDQRTMRARIERLRPLDPAVFARRALDGVARDEPVIVLPRWWRLVWALQGFAPSLVDRALRRLYLRERSRVRG